VLTAKDDRVVRWKSIGRGRGRNDPGRGRNLTIIKPERAEEFLAGVQLAFAAN